MQAGAGTDHRGVARTQRDLCTVRRQHDATLVHDHEFVGVHDLFMPPRAQMQRTHRRRPLRQGKQAPHRHRRVRRRQAGHEGTEIDERRYRGTHALFPRTMRLHQSLAASAWRYLPKWRRKPASARDRVLESLQHAGAGACAAVTAGEPGAMPSPAGLSHASGRGCRTSVKDRRVDAPIKRPSLQDIQAHRRR